MRDRDGWSLDFVGDESGGSITVYRPDAFTSKYQVQLTDEDLSGLQLAMAAHLHRLNSQEPS